MNPANGAESGNAAVNRAAYKSNRTFEIDPSLLRSGGPRGIVDWDIFVRHFFGVFAANRVGHHEAHTCSNGTICYCYCIVKHLFQEKKSAAFCRRQGSPG